MVIKESVSFVCLGVAVCAASVAFGTVDPFFGSGGEMAAVSEGMARGWTWEKARTGNTHPGAVMPFGWVSACGYSGGYSSGYGRFGCSGSGPAPEKIKTLRIFGFTHFHHNGCGWIGSFLNYCLFTPHVEGVDTQAASSVANERAYPGYYAAELVDYGAAFELTVNSYAALHRYAFPKGRGLVKADFTAAGYRGDIFGGRKGYKERPDSFVVTQAVDGVWSGEIVSHKRPRYFALLAKDATSKGLAAGVIEFAFAAPKGETILAFSDENVIEALARVRAAEREGFDATRTAAGRAWTETMDGIKAAFAEQKDIDRFESCIYHSFQKPVEYRPGRFAEYSTVWDMYRAQVPLTFSFLPTALARRLALNLLATSEEFGYFPNTFALAKRPSHNDNQATALGVYVLADACFRGLVTQDEYLRAKAFFEREFKTANIAKRSLTHVLDVAGAYRAAAFVARQFGDAASAKAWTEASSMWRRAYDPATGLMPKGQVYYEGDERNYSFRPHVGMNERVALAGGRAKFEEMLNDFFAVNADFSKWTPKTDRSRRIGHFEGLNNEADMNTPLAWYWAGRADRVCEVHDLIRRCRFADGEGGLPGNNDAGGTSAWYVWSCLGLYPASGAPYVFLVSPTVTHADLRFANGAKLAIEVKRPSAKAIYPCAIAFNGQAVTEPWLPIATLQKGGTLVFTMSETSAGPSPIPTWF